MTNHHPDDGSSVAGPDGVHVDVTWYGCPVCHMIWPDNRLCCELTDEDPPDAEIATFTGATLTYWDKLPDDNPGGLHPGITRFNCGLFGKDIVDSDEHGLRRAAYRVQFDDERVDPIDICHKCARDLFGVGTTT